MSVNSLSLRTHIYICVCMRVCIMINSSTVVNDSSQKIAAYRSPYLICTMPSPWVRGILRLIWPIVVFEHCNAARVQSTLVPKLQYPCLSGGDTCVGRSNSRNGRTTTVGLVIGFKRAMGGMAFSIFLVGQCMHGCT